jgi:transposase-like protein
MIAVRWYLRYGLSYRDVEELLAERRVDVDHVTSTDGCNGSRRCWPTPRDSPVIRRVTGAWHHVEQYANNPIEADHSQLKRRLRPMRGLQTDQSAQVVIAGHAFL